MNVGPFNMVEISKEGMLPGLEFGLLEQLVWCGLQLILAVHNCKNYTGHKNFGFKSSMAHAGTRPT